MHELSAKNENEDTKEKNEIPRLGFTDGKKKKRTKEGQKIKRIQTDARNGLGFDD